MSKSTPQTIQKAVSSSDPVVATLTAFIAAYDALIANFEQLPARPDVELFTRFTPWLTMLGISAQEVQSLPMLQDRRAAIASCLHQYQEAQG